jgi:short-subunit dehydrogenase
MMDIQGKAVIVTGASGGIGLETARLFAQRGARLALAARSGDKLAQLAQELPDALAIPTDMRDVEAVRRMVQRAHEHFGRIDVLINNAGQGMRATIEDTDIEEYRRMLDLNLVGPLVAMQAVIPIMRAQGGGIIINISSMTSKMYIPGLGAYSGTKRALNGMTLTARAELTADNIRVGVVHPRLTATQFGVNAFQGRRRGEWAPGRSSGRPMPLADPPSLVAERILAAVESEASEQYMSEEEAQNNG